MPLQGSCLCGGIKVAIKDGSLPLQPVGCHCYNCRTTAGSVISLVAVVKLDDLSIEGNPGEYRDANTKSGNTTSRFFCRDCGAPIHTQGPSRPDATVIKMGLFAGKMPIEAPTAELFWANHEKWEQPIPGATQIEYMPSPSK